MCHFAGRIVFHYKSTPHPFRYYIRNHIIIQIFFLIFHFKLDQQKNEIETSRNHSNQQLEATKQSKPTFIITIKKELIINNVDY
ncbi:hypothetical protein C0569_26490 [Priestia megaterium]|nr:hypothetical protein DC428_02595 [Priestia megaterium]PVE99776.1 hypothetical protein DC433_11525 [Priestia megaterium]QBK12149.1 hypothetical protein C0569_26490 [Priestia megaterium]